jgi:type I restriction enzyme S subunit
MSSERVVYRLEEVCEFINGFAFKSTDYIQPSEETWEVLRMGYINRGGGFKEDSTPVFIPKQYGKNLNKYIIQPNDIVISMTDMKNNVAILGNTARIVCSNRFVLNQRVGCIRVKRPDLIDPVYLYYYSNWEPHVDYLRSRANSGVQVNLSTSAIKEAEIEVPPLQEQKTIASILSTIDDRITLLRETNTTLEAIAQALFKSWFVDFDPVQAKQQGRAPEGMDAQTAALFPDSFEESELGMVPKGWLVSPMGKFCSVTIGGLWGKDTQEEKDLVPAISLRGVDLENLRLNGFALNAPVRWVKETALEKRNLKDSQVLIASSGAGPCGRALWAGGPFEKIYQLPVIFSNFVKRFECGNEDKALYIDRILADMRASSEIWNFINGTSIPNLDDKLLLSTKNIVMPSDELLDAFSKILKPIYAKLYEGKEQTLAALRDTLLPRLISGQLRLPEAQAQLESVDV